MRVSAGTLLYGSGFQGAQRACAKQVVQKYRIPQRYNRTQTEVVALRSVCQSGKERKKT